MSAVERRVRSFLAVKAQLEREYARVHRELVSEADDAATKRNILFLAEFDALSYLYHALASYHTRLGAAWGPDYGNMLRSLEQMHLRLEAKIEMEDVELVPLRRQLRENAQEGGKVAHLMVALSLEMGFFLGLVARSDQGVSIAELAEKRDSGQPLQKRRVRGSQRESVGRGNRTERVEKPGGKAGPPHTVRPETAVKLILLPRGAEPSTPDTPASLHTPSSLHTPLDHEASEPDHEPSEPENWFAPLTSWTSSHAQAVAQCRAPSEDDAVAAVQARFQALGAPLWRDAARILVRHFGVAAPRSAAVHSAFAAAAQAHGAADDVRVAVARKTGVILDPWEVRGRLSFRRLCSGGFAAAPETAGLDAHVALMQRPRRPDQHYRARLHRICYSGFWTFSRYRTIVTTAEYVALLAPADPARGMLRLRFMTVLRLRFLREFSMKVPVDVLQGRLARLLEGGVFEGDTRGIVEEALGVTRSPPADVNGHK